MKLQDELIEIQGQSDILNRDLNSKQDQLSDEKHAHRAAAGRSERRCAASSQASKKEADAANHIEGQLVPRSRR